LLKRLCNNERTYWAKVKKNKNMCVEGGITVSGTGTEDREQNITGKKKKKQREIPLPSPPLKEGGDETETEKMRRVRGRESAPFGL
jgi:hypothetical protein